MVRLLRRVWRDQRGQSLVERALVLPLLLLLLAGIVDLGRAFYSHIAITNAAREGARRASRYPRPVDGTGYAFVKQAVLDECQAAGIVLTMDDVAITTGAGGTEPGFPITVTVDYTVATILGSIVGYEYLPMSAATSMVIFGTG